MILKTFIDSDIVLDVGTGREPFFARSKTVLNIIEANYSIGYISANSVTNIYYILRKLSSSEKAKQFINNLLLYLNIIETNQKNIYDALLSDIKDFEDAVQVSCANFQKCDCIVTRNLDDFKCSNIQVYSPEEYIVLFKDRILTSAST
jgi:predicted nucleic acid-binding protein